MNVKLRNDLKGCGWSMENAGDWPNRLLSEMPFWEGVSSWGAKWYPSSLPPVLKPFAEEYDWLLHEALPDEEFYLDTVEVRFSGSHHWHIDGGYLRVILTCSGDGTLAAMSFENNVMTPPGYAIIFTGQQRHWKIGIPETWHSAPRYNVDRSLVLLNFRNQPYF
jgi:hypothetical protein